MDKWGLLIIDYLSEAPCKLKLLLSGESALIFNKPPICLRSFEIVNLVSQLADEKLIFLSCNDQPVSLNGESQKIDGKAKDYLLSLTQEGGRVWEHTMQPDWSKYIGVSIQYDRGGNETATVEAANVSTLQDVLNVFPNEIVQHININKLQPWKALYWKTLEVGHSITVSYPEGSIPDDFYCKITPKWKKDWAELGFAS